MGAKAAARRTSIVVTRAVAGACVALVAACGSGALPATASSSQATSSAPATSAGSTSGPGTSSAGPSEPGTPDPATSVPELPSGGTDSGGASSSADSIDPLPPGTLPDGYTTDVAEQRYLDQVTAQWDRSSARGTSLPGRTDLLDIGRSLCSAWHDGRSVSDVKTALTAAPQIGLRNGTVLVIGAGQFLCPQDYPPDGG